MRKQKSVIFVTFCCFLMIQGCGVKGPLYQTAPEQATQHEKSEDSTKD